MPELAWSDAGLPDDEVGRRPRHDRIGRRRRTRAPAGRRSASRQRRADEQRHDERRERSRRRGGSSSDPSRRSGPRTPTSDAADGRPASGSRSARRCRGRAGRRRATRPATRHITTTRPTSASPRPARAAAGRATGRASIVGPSAAVIRPGPRRAAGPGSTCRPSARTRPGRGAGRGRAWRRPRVGIGSAARTPGRGLRRRRRPGEGAGVERDHDAAHAARAAARPAAGPRTGSSEAVMTTAVMPRRSRATDADERLDERGRRSASTAARSCMIFWCWRPPRSAGRCAVRPALTVMPDRPVLGDRLVGDRGRGPDGDLGRRLVAAAGLDAALEVEDDPRVGGLLEVELLDLDLAVAGGRLPVDAVHAVARGVRAGRSWPAASSGASARARRGCPRGWPPAGATAAAARAAGRRRR